MYSRRIRKLQAQMRASGEPRLTKKAMSSFQRYQVGMDLASIGKRWTFHIIYNIGVLEVDRFNVILRSIPGLTPRVLAIRLNELEERGLIRPIVIRQGPKQVRWELTEKGRDTLPIVQGYLSYARK